MPNVRLLNITIQVQGDKMPCVRWLNDLQRGCGADASLIVFFGAESRIAVLRHLESFG